ncbi:MAG: spore coat polysaccharide biosynthesis protein SpsF (cytidylyltransferase family) [Polaribacter sp.]|jgi:spore coat polysaccharide biosynthesis protein SpsF (cytidylyltransferase family)/sialic acid synthase SpsE
MYTIIEIANTHGGNENYLKELIHQFDEYRDNFGMKFQPLHPDKLSTKDFAGYKIYQQLHFKNEQWKSFLSQANKTKDIWLDLFDDYGVEILEDNLEIVHGIKFQVSVLFNIKLIDKLSKIDLTKQKLIINVASLEEDEIKYHFDLLKEKLKVKELLIEVGFQAYPTAIEDSGLSKIQRIKDLFNCKVVFADHIDGKDELAVWLPVLALASGADYIEKHVMLGDDFKTEFDFYSSVTPEKFKSVIKNANLLDSLKKEPFINKREELYLTNSILKPILKSDKQRGEGISLLNDFDFKRTSQDGLNIIEIKALLNSYHIISTDVKKGSTLQNYHFKKANISVIIAARLKSSRLKEKALLKIGDLTSVEKCIKNACSFENMNSVILATSILESDSALKEYTFNDAVIFHRGDPEDVIDRYLQIIRKKEIDVFVRVTGDNPFIDNDLLQILLKSHFEEGADYSTAKEAPIGTNLEIINVTALEKVKEHFPIAEYSEYMTWYFVNNPDYFDLNYVNLPEKYIRPYRLTLDYEEDLKMYKIIDENLSNKNKNYKLIDVLSYLDNNQDVSSINAHIQATYVVDQKLIDTLSKKTKINL